MGNINLTMSWDDGSLHDMRLAELLSKYDIRSTFYIPKNNVEGIQVLPDTDIRELSKQFEIGCHTIDHVRLNRLPDKEHDYQIRHSKEWLEDVTGGPIQGFCYPGGVYDIRSIIAVKKAGFYYSRTTENFQRDIDDLFEMPTTLQIHNHKNIVLSYNIIKSKNSWKRISDYYPILLTNSLSKRLEYVLDHALKKQVSYLHFWGHSWEIDQFNNWCVLEDFFKVIKEKSQLFNLKTNYQCALQNEKSLRS
jgi:peptidoglycan/xylan/chitin deacetylase (PgdA/CDA1 family)